MPRRAVTSGGSRASTAILECGVLVLVLSAANVGTTCAESQSRLYAAYLRLRAVSMVLRTLFEHGDFPMDFYARFERGSCRVTAVSWHCGTVLTSASSAGPLRRSLHGSSVVCLCLRAPIVSSDASSKNAFEHQRRRRCLHRERVDRRLASLRLLLPSLLLLRSAVACPFVLKNAASPRRLADDRRHSGDPRAARRSAFLFSTLRCGPCTCNEGRVDHIRHSASQ